MTQRLDKQQLRELAVAHEKPVNDRAPTTVDRGFGLPTPIYAATVALYLGFIGVMAVSFLNPELAIPMVIFAGFVVFAFGLVGFWTRMKPENDTVAPDWGQFRARGIETLSGRLTAGEATIQVLMLPVLILGWGLAVAVIVALR
nr:hypothetical protein [Novosphingobium panipatense]